MVKNLEEQKLGAELFMKINDLALALALEEDEKIRKSEVFKRAQEVIKIVKMINEKRLNILENKPEIEEKKE